MPCESSRVMAGGVDPVEIGPSQRARLNYASFVSLPTSMVYMETPKAACTSFKHLIAALNGVDIAKLEGSVMAAKSAAQAIHDRSLIDVPSLLQIPDNQRAHVLSAESYLRFCIVRNPYTRLASAWTDRLLCHSLSPLAPILRHIEFPEYVPEWQYLRCKFSEFVDHLYRREFPLMTNHHWQLQHDLLLPDLLNYNLVVRLEELPRHLPRIIAHVEAQGVAWPGLPRINETPLKLAPGLYTAATVRKVREMFAEDFARYGYDTRAEIAGGDAGPLPDAEVVRGIQQRNRRIFLLSLKQRGML